MDALIIESTEVSPKIIFDPENNIFEISGESRPENVRKFYDPIINWLDEYGRILLQKKEDKSTLFTFKFEYFNSSSAKFIMDILKKIESLHLKGIKFSINWYYDEGDEDMEETGGEFARIIEIPFKFIVNKEG